MIAYLFQWKNSTLELGWDAWTLLMMGFALVAIYIERKWKK